MQNFLLLHIQSHLSIIEVALQSSQRMQMHAKSGDLSSFEAEGRARDQIMTVLDQLQEDIENQVNDIKSAYLSETLLPIIRSWINDASMIFEEIGHVDSVSLEYLSQIKDAETSDFVTRFKSAPTSIAYR